MRRMIRKKWRDKGSLGSGDVHGVAEEFAGGSASACDASRSGAQGRAPSRSARSNGVGR